MKTSTLEKTDAYLLEMEGNLDIEGAQGIKSSIENAFIESDEVLVDVQNVESIHLTYIHMFCSASLTASEIGKKFKVNGASARVLEFMRNIGYGHGNCCSLSAAGSCPWQVSNV